MILTLAQNEIAKDTHRFRVVRIGRRGGKTTLASEEIKGKILAKPSRVAYIAPNYGQARDIAWELFKKEFQPIIISTNEQRLEIRTRTIKGGESLIVLRGWESIETLRGQAFDFLVIDEVAMMRNFWSNWQEVLRPTLTDTKGDVMFISTPKGYNHFYDLCNLELTDENFKSFHFTSYDNPHIPEDEIDTAKTQLTKERFIQEYLAEFSKTEGLVYKEFSRNKHLYSELPEGKFDKVGGIDFGYRNPAAVLDIRTNGDDFYVENEWYKKERTEIQIAEYVARCGFNAVYPDPESPSAIKELENKNINVREVVKGKDSVVSGIQKIRELLKSEKLKINKHCVNLISEFEMYSTDDEDSDKNSSEKPIKANDHALDALRYVIFMMLPEGKIEDVKFIQLKQEPISEFEGRTDYPVEDEIFDRKGLGNW